jgi:hypothetical protein
MRAKSCINELDLVAFEGTEKPNTSLFTQNKGGRSLAWLGLRLPEPATRVRIPATAPNQDGLFRLRFTGHNSIL